MSSDSDSSSSTEEERSRKRAAKRTKKRSKKSTKKPTKKRKRKRQTSSSDSSSSSESDDSNAPKRKTKKAKKRRREVSSSSESSSSDSSDSSDYKKRKRKKRKKAKSKKKSKKQKKSKQKKKNKEAEVANEQQSAPTGPYTGYGVFAKFGMITKRHRYDKVDEFMTWLIDQKGIDRGTLNEKEEDRLFVEYADDYNMAKLPHLKYYNLAQWEMNNTRQEKTSTFGREEDFLRFQRKMARENQAKRVDAVRVKAMMTGLKTMNKDQRKAISRKHAPENNTFEAIRAKRQQEQKEKKARETGNPHFEDTWD